MSYLRIGPLVRAMSTNTVVLWAELSQPCELQIQITPTDISDTSTGSEIRVTTTTTQVGEHYYIAPQIQGLLPSTWYTYSLFTVPDNEELTSKSSVGLLQCFRTFDLPETDTVDEQRELRIAYGSCRKAEQDPTDAFHAFGLWLKQQHAQREESWPHLLLLIGDQIYADQPSAELLRSHPHLHEGAQTFADYTLFYEHAWANDPDVQQALAVIPTFMMFDDHEICNDWNVDPIWRNKAIRDGKEQMLVDGLVAYWVYQGWGNLAQDAEADHPLLAIMHKAAQSGEDALEELRSCVKADIYNLTPIRWHYIIQTQPGIFVANARTERTSIFDQTTSEYYGPTRIMNQKQMQDIQQWLQSQQQPIFVSSVPVLLPPLIGILQYFVGQRVWHEYTWPIPLRWLGKQIARFQLFAAHKANFDHWPLYTSTWHEFIQSVQKQQKDIIILSGDVHFSYALDALFTTPGKAHHLYQLVSTPLQNVLGDKNERQVRLQAAITRITYDGLHSRILPLKTTSQTTRTYKDLLFENTLAFVTIQRDSHGTDQIKHEYMGSVDGELQVIGVTELPARS